MIHSYNIPVQNGWTPLLISTLEGYSNVVKLLIQHQVQLEIENNVSTHINIMNYKLYHMHTTIRRAEQPYWWPAGRATMILRTSFYKLEPTLMHRTRWVGVVKSLFADST